MTARPVYIGAAGMACPLGLGLAPACAAVRCGLSRRAVSGFRDDQGNEIVASYLQSGLAEDADAEQRWLYLLGHALADIVRSTGKTVFQRAPLLIALPPAHDRRPFDPRIVAETLGSHLRLSVDPRRVRMFTEGSAGAFAALSRARETAREGQPCVVAAADSLLCAPALLKLMEQRRLLVEGNPDGATPGEAAAAVWLTREPGAARACVRGIGFGAEPSRLDNDVPLRAHGLVAAAREALGEAGLPLHALDFRISDAAGESFYFKEQALLISRLLEQPKQAFPLWLAARSIGHTGAAGGLVGLAWAMSAWERGYAPGPLAIGFAGNDTDTRAAVVLERYGEGSTHG